MPTLNWKLATGATADWSVGANWDTGIAPASGDIVVVNYGNANIISGLNQSAVALAKLTFGPNFSGTVGSTAAFPAPLQIGVSSTNPIIINTSSNNISLDVGSTTPQILVLNTGSPASPNVGVESFRVRGGGAGATIAVTGTNTSVGIATDYAGLTATMEPSVNNGVLNVGVGVTWTNILQSSDQNTSGGVLTTFGGGTKIQQSGATGNLFTYGSAKITTLVITGFGYIGNRPVSGTDAFSTLSIGPSATVDASQDPAPFTITTMIIMSIGSTWITFNPAQCQINGGGAYPIEFQLCSPRQANVQTGSPCKITVDTF